MNFNRLTTVFMSIVLMTACGKKDNLKTTASGVEVDIVESGIEGKPVKDSTYLQLSLKYTDDKGNVMWDSEQNGSPTIIPYNKSGWAEQGMLYEALEVLEVGDSAVFKVPTKNVFEVSFRSTVPDTLDTAGYVTFYAKLLNMWAEEEYRAYQQEQIEKQQAEQLAAAAEQIAKDGEEIDKYLQENGIEAQITDSGLRYVITQEGTGESAQVGQNVEVHYTGMLMDGTKFDSSLDRDAPFTFTLGQGQVIRGWDEGIALLNKGAKATLYIPSSLAYGERGGGEKIGPNAILKFDVELIDVQSDQ